MRLSTIISLGRFLRDRRGSPAVEFALAFPAVIGLTLAIVEIGYIQFAEVTLEGAVRDASRRGVTGFVPEAQSRKAYVEGRIVTLMDKFPLNGDVDISTRVYDSFGDIGKPEPFTDENDNGSYDPGECFTDINQNGTWDSDMADTGLGGAGSIVVYTASVDLETLTPVFAWFTEGGDDSIRLDASTAVRNEPFNVVSNGEDGTAPEVCGS